MKIDIGPNAVVPSPRGTERIANLQSPTRSESSSYMSSTEECLTVVVDGLITRIFVKLFLIAALLMYAALSIIMVKEVAYNSFPPTSVSKRDYFTRICCVPAFVSLLIPILCMNAAFLGQMLRWLLDGWNLGSGWKWWLRASSIFIAMAGGILLAALKAPIEPGLRGFWSRLLFLYTFETIGFGIANAILEGAVFMGSTLFAVLGLAHSPKTAYTKGRGVLRDNSRLVICLVLLFCMLLGFAVHDLEVEMMTVGVALTLYVAVIWMWRKFWTRTRGYSAFTGYFCIGLLAVSQLDCAIGSESGGDIKFDRIRQYVLLLCVLAILCVGLVAAVVMARAHESHTWLQVLCLLLLLVSVCAYLFATYACYDAGGRWSAYLALLYWTAGLPSTLARVTPHEQQLYMDEQLPLLSPSMSMAGSMYRHDYAMWMLLVLVVLLASTVTILMVFAAYYSQVYFAHAPAQCACPIVSEVESYTYPLCGGRWLGLGILDLARLSSAIYNPNSTAVEAYVQAIIGPSWYLSYDRSADPTANGIGGVQFLEFRNDATNVSVISVRGTVRFQDWMQDVSIWLESALVQLAGSLGSFMTAWPSDSIAGVIDTVNKGIPVRPAEQYWRPVEQRTLQTMGEKYKMLLVGHSLGGGLAKIVAGHQKVPAVTFSSPGLEYSHLKFGLKREDLDPFVTTVVPEYDYIPYLDRQTGLVQRISCETGSPMDCHLMCTTLCELEKACLRWIS